MAALGLAPHAYIAIGWIEGVADGLGITVSDLLDQLQEFEENTTEKRLRDMAPEGERALQRQLEATDPERR